MRKASHDGCDSTSITSGFENEIKKVGSNFMKTKKSSLKRKVPNFSLESDDGVIEPLLQKDKENSEANQSAKYSLPKLKAESTNAKNNDTDKLLDDLKADKLSITNIPSIYSNGVKNNSIVKTSTTAFAPLHNHMNTNAFASTSTNVPTTAKSPILVEIETSKQSGSASALIFTTAKIHSDGKINHMEPVQVTPVPILSTVEGNVVKSLPILDQHTSSAKDLNVNNCVTFAPNLSTNPLPSSTTVETVINDSMSQPFTKTSTYLTNNTKYFDKNNTISSVSSYQFVPVSSISNLASTKLSSLSNGKPVQSVIKTDDEKEKLTKIDKTTAGSKIAKEDKNMELPTAATGKSKNTTISINYKSITDANYPENKESKMATNKSLKRQKPIVAETPMISHTEKSSDTLSKQSSVSKINTSNEVSATSTSQKEDKKSLGEHYVDPGGLKKGSKSLGKNSSKLIQKEPSVDGGSSKQPSASNTKTVTKSMSSSAKATSSPSQLPVKTLSTSSVKTQISTSTSKPGQTSYKTKVSSTTTKQAPSKISISTNATSSSVTSTSTAPLISSTSKKQSDTSKDIKSSKA